MKELRMSNQSIGKQVVVVPAPAVQSDEDSD